MFYEITPEGLRETAPAQASPDTPLIGYVSVEELGSLGGAFGFEESSLAACREEGRLFRFGVESFEEYTFTKLRVMNSPGEDDDCIALFMKKNLLVVADIRDTDGSTREKFMAAAVRGASARGGTEKTLAVFLDSLMAGDAAMLENVRRELEDFEERILTGKAEENVTAELLARKKFLSQHESYYAQLMDIADSVTENENEIFHEDRLMYVGNVSRHAGHLREDTAALVSGVERLEDAYSARLDSEMNKSMKTFTVLTSIFFPLTIIVGWYGMNFKYIPELGWRGGYLFVIALSVVTVFIVARVAKRKKWY